MITNTHIITFDMPTNLDYDKPPLKYFNGKLNRYGGRIIDTKISGQQYTAIFEMNDNNFNDYIFSVSSYPNCNVLL